MLIGSAGSSLGAQLGQVVQESDDPDTVGEHHVNPCQILDTGSIHSSKSSLRPSGKTLDSSTIVARIALTLERSDDQENAR